MGIWNSVELLHTHCLPYSRFTLPCLGGIKKKTNSNRCWWPSRLPKLWRHGSEEAVCSRQEALRCGHLVPRGVLVLRSVSALPVPKPHKDQPGPQLPGAASWAGLEAESSRACSGGPTSSEAWPHCNMNSLSSTPGTWHLYPRTLAGRSAMPGTILDVGSSL